MNLKTIFDTLDSVAKITNHLSNYGMKLLSIDMEQMRLIVSIKSTFNLKLNDLFSLYHNPVALKEETFKCIAIQVNITTRIELHVKQEANLIKLVAINEFIIKEIENPYITIDELIQQMTIGHKQLIS